jgi:hypothetical protein
VSPFPGDICPFSSMHLTAPSWPDVVGYRSHRERTANRNGALLRPTHDSDLSWRTSNPGNSVRRDHTDRALWSARAGSRGLSGKGRKSQRSSNPASQRHRVVGFHDVYLSGFALSAPVARAVTETRSQCVRWAGGRGLPPSKSTTSHGCDSSVSTRAMEVRAGRTGLSDSAVAGSTPATRTACVAQRQSTEHPIH